MDLKYKIGIVLSGGGARGIAHIGVLKGLESAGIFPEIISGCSAGAMVGALYAEGLSPNTIFSFVEKKSVYSIFRMSMPNKGVMELTYFRKILLEHIRHDSFENLKIPLYISVTNLNTGICEYIHSGKLIEYVIASQSIPLIFKPVQIQGNLYTDGGVLNNLPVEPIREQCEILIGVNVNPVHYYNDLKGMRDVGYRVLLLSLKANMQSRIPLCDFVIEPSTESFSIFDVNKAKQIFDEGYKAALKVAGQVRDKLNLQRRDS